MLKSFTKTQSIFRNKKCFHKRKMVTFPRKRLLMKFHSSNLVIYARMEQNPSPEILPNFTVLFFRYREQGFTLASVITPRAGSIILQVGRTLKNYTDIKHKPWIRNQWSPHRNENWHGVFCYIISFYTSSFIVFF